jgi:hypothetical protein
VQGEFALAGKGFQRAAVLRTELREMRLRRVTKKFDRSKPLRQNFLYRLAPRQEKQA